jgi:hypothetical protein
MTAPAITAWSYSRYEVWAQCPKKAFYKFVAKYPEGPKSAALLRGIDAHEVCAKIYRGEWSDSEAVSLGWRQLLAKHKSFYGPDLEAELQLAFDKDWAPTDWFSKQTVFRCAFDGMAFTPHSTTLLIKEHKTGKKWPGHVEQAGLYAMVGALVVPDAQNILVDVQYLDLPVTRNDAVMRVAFSREGVEQQAVKWHERSKELLADTEFPTRAGVHCRWCPYRNSAGGPCHLG